MHAILDSEIENIPERIDDYLEKIADSALDGARGNSGAIMAQFFQGLSQGSQGIDKMTTVDFSKAVFTASSLSREALSDPIEGTIITVIDDFSSALKSCVDRGIRDFELLFKEALTQAQSSLENTPNLLPILKQSGVVDAGAQGFVDLLDGVRLQGFFLQLVDRISIELAAAYENLALAALEEDTVPLGGAAHDIHFHVIGKSTANVKVVRCVVMVVLGRHAVFERNRMIPNDRINR